MWNERNNKIVCAQVIESNTIGELNQQEQFDVFVALCNCV